MPPILMHPETAAILNARRRRNSRAIWWMLIGAFGAFGLYALAERFLPR